MQQARWSKDEISDVLFTGITGVIIDGRPHGTAPVTGVKVSPGSHTVVFMHKEYGTKSRTVTVAAGQTATAAVRFDPSSGSSKKKKKKKKS